MAFCTLLDVESEQRANEMLLRWVVFGGSREQPSSGILPKDLQHFLTRKGQLPESLRETEAASRYMEMFGYFITRGNEPTTSEHQQLIDRYIITPSISKNLKNLTRSLLAGYPILLQGPTSAGKTSMIEYLAALTGHRFVRINNHEHTDLQEYVGSYVWDETEKRLVFREGVLVQALRNGKSPEIVVSGQTFILFLLRLVGHFGRVELGSK
jgi:midasin (ATPase involved in ribosome maturation)